MEEHNPDLLGVSVSTAGFAYLKRLVSLTRWTFIVSIVFYFISLVNSLFYRLAINPEKYRGNWTIYLELQLRIWYIIAAGILFTYQLYLYLVFSRRTTAAFQAADSDAFNRSFGLLLRSNRAAVACLALGIAFGMLELLIGIQYWLATLHAKT